MWQFEMEFGNICLEKRICFWKKKKKYAFFFEIQKQNGFFRWILLKFDFMEETKICLTGGATLPNGTNLTVCQNINYRLK